jgi:hypothetical protein
MSVFLQTVFVADATKTHSLWNIIIYIFRYPFPVALGVGSTLQF